MTETSTREFRRPPRFNLGHPLDPSSLRAGTPLLVAPFRSGDEFMQALSIDANMELRVVLPTRAELHPGEDVVLEIMWVGLPNRVYVRAMTLGRTQDDNLVLRVYPHEHPKLSFLSKVATDENAIAHAAIRKHPRYCVRLPLEWRAFGGSREMLEGTAEDISAGGVHLVSAVRPVNVDTSVVLRLYADSAGQDLVLTGAVRHVHVRGRSEMAIGVEFETASTGELKELRRLLRAFAANGIVLFEPEL